MRDLQAMDRAHRLGQRRTVNVYRLITRETIESRIMGLQSFKLGIARTVVSQQNTDVDSMQTESVLDLFAASRPAQSIIPTAPKAGKEPAGGMARLGFPAVETVDGADGRGELEEEGLDRTEAEYAAISLESFLTSLG